MSSITTWFLNNIYRNTDNNTNIILDTIRLNNLKFENINIELPTNYPSPEIIILLFNNLISNIDGIFKSNSNKQKIIKIHSKIMTFLKNKFTEEKDSQ